jgi:hypothetical protein
LKSFFLKKKKEEEGKPLATVKTHWRNTKIQENTLKIQKQQNEVSHSRPPG